MISPPYRRRDRDYDSALPDPRRWDDDKDDDCLWGSSLAPLIDSPPPVRGSMDDGVVQELLSATALLVRLDERLAGSVPSVRSGWAARLLVEDAAAAARLDGWLTDSRRLLEIDLGLASEPNEDDAKSLLVLQLMRAALRRSPRHLYHPARLMAAAGLRRPMARLRPGPNLPPWVELFVPERDHVWDVLSKALDRNAVAALDAQPALLGAAALLHRWHETGAAAALGGTLGRYLAGAWLVRQGMVNETMPVMSLGWLGARGAYIPGDFEHWPTAFLQALVRAAERGLQLQARLVTFRCRLLEAADAAGPKSALPRAIEVLVARPAVTSAGLATALAITPRAALGILTGLQAKGLVVDMMGRKSFRAWVPTVRP